MMNNTLDFVQKGYQIEQELGVNRLGGRVTYLATEIETQQKVVIKQFQFASTGSTWVDYDGFEREIQVLQSLDHPGIPKYLESFQIENGFCMVQQYKDAQSLAQSRSFSPDRVQSIATDLLEILVYLQSRIPPVIHRDIKPANVLVDASGHAYLVDFGFARIGEGEVGVSSVVKGTLGFMPPEQLFNRQLTEASDLYGLGMTLICLLTGTKADEIGNLVDISYQVKFKHLIPKLNSHWIRWLEKMVEPRVKDRYPNAIAAIKALPASSICLPEVHLSQSSIDLRANRLGEVLHSSITVLNPIPDTALEGEWYIDNHPKDGIAKAQNHCWIKIHPQTVNGDRTDCQLLLDTSQLMANKVYIRNLRLKTNASPSIHTVTLQIHTAPIPIQHEHISYRSLFLLFVLTLFLARINFGLVSGANLIVDQLSVSFLSNAIGTVLGLEIAAWTLGGAGSTAGSTAGAIGGGILGAVTLLAACFLLDVPGGDISTVVLSSVFGIGIGWVLGISIGLSVEKLLEGDVSFPTAIQFSLLTVASAASMALGLTLGFGYPYVIPGIAATSLPLIITLIYAPLRRARLITTHRRSERHLIRY